MPGATVYPRACGGTDGIRKPLFWDYGLSPRLRGNRFTPGRIGVSRRSIPAPAGEPFGFGPQLALDRVYPRACGGTSRTAPTCTPSPIPAPAGEPVRRSTSATRLAVYPRACGGTIKVNLFKMASQGLSPRLRGNHHPGLGCGEEDGSIPAPAGEPRRIDESD